MKRNKLIIIGLDGGTFKIIDPLIERGKLPYLKKLIRSGTRAILKSTIPPYTAPAWVSLMTGVNPGKHGLFDFKKIDKITHDMHPTPIPKETYTLMHSHYYAGKTIWDLLSKEGYKVSVITMPMTYPAWEINGYMLSGFPAPDFNNPSGYPLEWASSIGPLFDISAISINNEDRLINECYNLTKKIGAIFIDQLKKDLCDVYSIVFSATDFLQHHLWKYLSNRSSKYSSSIQKIYIEIDNIIGNALDLVEKEQSTFIILSDHGFTSSAKKYFNTNAWLIKEGYLATKEKKLFHSAFDYLLNPLRYQKISLRLLIKKYIKYLPQSLQRKISTRYYRTDLFDWSRTKAFRSRIQTAEGIVVNLKGGQPFGVVEEAEYEKVRDEIIRKLKEYKDNGEQVIREVYKREDIYKGKFVDLVPDIIFLLDYKYEGGLGINKNKITENIPDESVSAISGAHDMDGILIMGGPNIKNNIEIQPVNIIDIFPTILYNFGISIPNYTDGKVIKNAFKDEYASQTIKYIESPLFEEELHINLSTTEEEEEEMKKALKGLGYLS